MRIKWFWFYLQEIQNNFRSGVTVSLVSVPLSISLAIAGGNVLIYEYIKY